jgi:hypothetical protein
MGKRYLLIKETQVSVNNNGIIESLPTVAKNSGVYQLHAVMENSEFLRN